MTTYTTGEAATMLGVSRRQIDYWAVTGKITPVDGAASPGSGFRRRWNHVELLRMTAAVALAEELGVEPGRALDVIPTDPHMENGLLRIVVGTVDLYIDMRPYSKLEMPS